VDTAATPAVVQGRRDEVGWGCDWFKVQTLSRFAWQWCAVNAASVQDKVYDMEAGGSVTSVT